MDLKCEWAVVDTVSVLGTDQNVTTHVTKWQVDAEGVRRRFQGRNRQQNDIKLFDEGVAQTIEELVEDGEDAVSLDANTFEFARKEQEYLFMDFYASWCSHVSYLVWLGAVWVPLLLKNIAEPHLLSSKPSAVPRSSPNLGNSCGSHGCHC
jgi:hypothetical protein